MEENALFTECMDDITSHLAICHLSKCSKCSKDNENELNLAREYVFEAWWIFGTEMTI